MTNLSDIERLINLGESKILEFKSSFNNETTETLVAFANTNGGQVIIGINHKNEIIGVKVNEESVQNWVNEIKGKTAPSIIPDVEIYELESKIIIVFSINEFPVKPISLKGRYYKRLLNSNHLMGANEISQFHLQSLQTSWDAYPYHGAEPDDIDFVLVKDFIARVNLEGRFSLATDSLKALNKLRLIKKGIPTNAAMLLFSKQDLKTDTYQSHTRNKLIAEAFYLTKDIEKYGSGYIRVRDEINAYPTMKFEYEEKGSGFYVSLSYSEQKISTHVPKDVGKDDGKDDGKDVGKERKEKIIKQINENNKVSARQLSIILAVTERTIERDLTALKKTGKIKRIGGRKEGHWEVIENE